MYPVWLSVEQTLEPTANVCFQVLYKKTFHAVPRAGVAVAARCFITGAFVAARSVDLVPVLRAHYCRGVIAMSIGSHGPWLSVVSVLATC